MHPASVGFHCPECAKTGSQRVQRGIPSSRRRGALVVNALIAINVVVFVLELATGVGGGIDGGIATDGYLWGPAVGGGASSHPRVYTMVFSIVF